MNGANTSVMGIDVFYGLKSLSDLYLYEKRRGFKLNLMALVFLASSGFLNLYQYRAKKKTKGILDCSIVSVKGIILIAF